MEEKLFQLREKVSDQYNQLEAESQVFIAGLYLFVYLNTLLNTKNLPESIDSLTQSVNHTRLKEWPMILYSLFYFFVLIGGIKKIYNNWYYYKAFVQIYILGISVENE